VKWLRWIFASPWRLGLTISGTLLLALVASETALDRWPAIVQAAQGGALARQPTGILRDFRIAVVHCLLAGYLPAAIFAVALSGKRTVLALQGALDCTPAECESLAGSIRFSPVALTVAVLIGLGFGFGTPYLTPPVPQDLWNPSTWSPEVTWHRILGPMTSAGGVVLAYAIVAVSRRMSSLAADLKSIDLFDVEPLLPFTQLGLVNALLLMGLVAIAGLMVLTESGFGILGALLGAAIFGTAGIALALPMHGVHRRITKAKAAELAWVDGQLREQRAVLKSGAERTSGDLSDLAAYRELVRSVRDWPINTSSYLRFALYLLIPVISWAAAALVERFVDTLVF
jgi:hypothetical protein